MEELDKIDWTLFKDWLSHPVTKVVLIVIAAELAKQLAVKHGMKMAFPDEIS